MIRVPGSRSWIRIRTLYPSRIPERKWPKSSQEWQRYIQYLWLFVWVALLEAGKYFRSIPFLATYRVSKYLLISRALLPHAIIIRRVISNRYIWGPGEGQDTALKSVFRIRNHLNWIRMQTFCWIRIPIQTVAKSPDQGFLWQRINFF